MEAATVVSSSGKISMKAGSTVPDWMGMMRGGGRDGSSVGGGEAPAPAPFFASFPAALAAAWAAGALAAEASTMAEGADPLVWPDADGRPTGGQWETLHAT